MASAPHYVLEVRREGRLDELDVLVETRAEFAGTAIADWPGELA